MTLSTVSDADDAVASTEKAAAGWPLKLTDSIPPSSVTFKLDTDTRRAAAAADLAAQPPAHVSSTRSSKNVKTNGTVAGGFGALSSIV